MGVGIDLIGRFRKKGLLSRTPAPDKCLEALDDWFKRQTTDLVIESRRAQGDDGLPVLAVDLHPAAESVQIRATDGGRVTVACKTSTAGPGFHAYVCDTLRRAGADLNIEWSRPDPDAGTGDPTGYFETSDFAPVRREMLSWLGTAVRSLSDLIARDYTGLALSLPPDVSFRHDGVLATPMGPRSEQWLREVADAPARGADVFPWWQQGTGAPYHLGRALTRMWTDVRWRKPQTDEARKVIDEVLRDLRRALALAPDLDYPWREWHELNGFVGAPGAQSDVVSRRAKDVLDDQPLIGYRRRDVTASLAGNWSIVVPGSFETIVDDESWQAFDEERVVYFSSLTVGGGPAGPPPAEELLTSFPAPEGRLLETFEHKGNRVIGKAALVEVEEAGRTLLRLSATSATRGSVGISTIDLYDPSHRQWALDTWKSIDHPSE